MTDAPPKKTLAPKALSFVAAPTVDENLALAGGEPAPVARVAPVAGATPVASTATPLASSSSAVSEGPKRPDQFCGLWSDSYPYQATDVIYDPITAWVWKSLRNGNQNHPLSDSEWWESAVDETEADEMAASVHSTKPKGFGPIVVPPPIPQPEWAIAQQQQAALASSEMPTKSKRQRKNRNKQQQSASKTEPSSSSSSASTLTPTDPMQLVLKNLAAANQAAKPMTDQERQKSEAKLKEDLRSEQQKELDRKRLKQKAKQARTEARFGLPQHLRHAHKLASAAPIPAPPVAAPGGAGGPPPPIGNVAASVMATPTNVLTKMRGQFGPEQQKRMDKMMPIVKRTTEGIQKQISKKQEEHVRQAKESSSAASSSPSPLPTSL